MAATLAVGKSNSFQGEIIALGGGTGEDDFLRVGVYGLSKSLPAFL